MYSPYFTAEMLCTATGHYYRYKRHVALDYEFAQLSVDVDVPHFGLPVMKCCDEWVETWH